MDIKNNPKILVAAPTFDGMRYCHKQFIDRIKSLSYGDYDILLADNSENNSFFKELKKDPHVASLRMDLPGISNLKKIIRSRNKLLTHATLNSYDYVLMMDVDVIPPFDIIERLLAHGKDIVSGLYYNIFRVDRQQRLLPVAWKSFTPEEFEKIKDRVFSSHVASHESLRRNLTDEEIKSGELQEVIIPSAGCVLLSEKVFKKIKYGLLDVPGGFVTSDDIYFFRKAREAGFKLYCDPAIICDHLIRGKFERSGNELSHPTYS